MPTNFTPVTNTSPANAAAWNNPLTELDDAIEAQGDGSKTMASPAIISFTNSQHDHEDAAGGGQLTLTAVSSSGYTSGQVAAANGSGGWTATSLVQLPAGIILPYGGAAAPTGWLLCDGQAVSRTTYATLFGVIGTLFGAGDGSTTFNVPDLRGRVPVGQDDMGGSAANRITAAWADTVGQADGTESHTLVTGEMPSHQHDERYSDNSSNPQTLRAYSASSGANYSLAIANLTSVNVGTVLQTAATGGGGAHNNIQPSIAVNFIVKT